MRESTKGLQQELIKLGSENPGLRPHIARILDQVGPGANNPYGKVANNPENLLEDLLDYDALMDWVASFLRSPEMGETAQEILRYFDKRLTLSRKEGEALGRLRAAIKQHGGGGGGGGGDVNELGKIAVLLGIRPNFSF